MRIMSLGSNCADLAYLGEHRVKGPVDNFLVVNGLSDTLSLFSDFDQQMKNGFLSSKHRQGSYRGDCRTKFTYKNWHVLHIYMDDESNVNKVLSRYEDFKEHLKHINEEGFFFSYSISFRDVFRNKLKASFYVNLEN